MLVYSFILLLLLFGTFHFDVRKNVFLSKFYYVLTFVVMTLMVGLRYRLGGDSLQYEDYFGYLPVITDLPYYLKGNNSFNYQPLYLAFVGICKWFDDDYYFYQFVHAVIVNTIIFWFIHRYTKYRYTTLLVLYILLFYFYFTFEIQREILAICCFLLGYNSYLKKRWLVYYLFAATAFLFHISAFILFVLPLFRLIQFNRKFIYVALLIGLPLIFAKSFLFDLFKIFFVSEAMQSKGDAYAEMDFSIAGLLIFYFVRVIINLPFLVVASKTKSSLDWLLSAYLVLSISSQVMVGFDRFLNYLYLPYILFIIDMMYSKFRHVKISGFKRKFALTAAFVNLFFVLGYKVVMDLPVTDRARYHSIFFPYGSVFEHERHIERENFMRELWNRK